MTYSARDVSSVLEISAADMQAHVEELRQLDSQLGDGDLGITIDMVCKALRAYLTSPGTDDIGKLLMNCAAKINQANPSTFGTLLSAGFMGAAKAAQGKHALTLEDLATVGQAAVAGIRKLGKADAGDKTLLDALIPAVNSFESKVKERVAVELAFESSVEAAKKGMESTTAMKAKFGRAAWHQDKSIGVQDAGATAIYFAIETFVKHIITINTVKRP